MLEIHQVRLGILERNDFCYDQVQTPDTQIHIIMRKKYRLKSKLGLSYLNMVSHGNSFYGQVCQGPNILNSLILGFKT